MDEVAIAATTQTGDQGLTIGRTAALLAGLPRTVPGFAIDRMCAGAMTAVTTTASGDDAIVDVVRLAKPWERVLVVTADRGLKERVHELGAETVGPKWLLSQLAD